MNIELDDEVVVYGVIVVIKFDDNIVELELTPEYVEVEVEQYNDVIE